MAAIEELIRSVADARLRDALAVEVGRLKAVKKFGLVFEEHLPETVLLPGLAPKVGARVFLKGTPEAGAFRVIEEVNDTKLKMVADHAIKSGIIRGLADTIVNTAVVVNKSDLIVAKAFGEPMYPALIPVDTVERAPGKPWHVLINADNYHALQLLQYGYKGTIDAIYIDPPYNTGARDWKYNNNYVDDQDRFRHSKWLSMLKKRLVLAKALMRPDDSVLIITIDEKEYLRLGLLLEDLFPECRVQMISTQINPAGVPRVGAFGRSDEYIFFVTMGTAAPQRVRLNRDWVSGKGRTHTGKIRWDLLRRSGEDAAREDSPGCFYAIYIEPNGPRVSFVGESLAPGVSNAPPRAGSTALLPIRENGTEGRWQWTPGTLRERLAQGRVRVTGNAKKGFVVSILKDGEYAKITSGEYQVTGNNPDGSVIVAPLTHDDVLAVPNSQWRVSTHDSTQYGSRLLSEAILPGRSFPFPKSLYAVEDALRFFVASKPNAVVLDFFSGSGTTTHAVARLNREDGGLRRSIVVTNNEVDEATSRVLQAKGLEPGISDEYEEHGICRAITWPRIKSCITGVGPSGKCIAGSYLDGRPMADGFEENAAYFTLDFLDPDEVSRGKQLEAVTPILWMLAGCTGAPHSARGAGKWLLPSGNRYAVLLREDCYSGFRSELAKRQDITHLFLVTDSAEAFNDMVNELNSQYTCIQLYSSYIDTFRINLGEAGTRSAAEHESDPAAKGWV